MCYLPYLTKEDAAALTANRKARVKTSAENVEMFVPEYKLVQPNCRDR